MARRALPLRGCTWIVGILLLGFVARDASAQTYSVEIRPTLNDLKVKIEQIPQTSLLMIKLTSALRAQLRRIAADAATQYAQHQSRRDDLQRIPGSTSLVQRHRRRDLPILVLRERSAMDPSTLGL